MPRACCGSPVAKIIQVANVNVGIVGLENALRNVYISGVDDEEKIKEELLSWIKDFGNYIPASREEDYKQALFREYKEYRDRIEREGKAQ